MIKESTRQEFTGVVWDFYHQHGRHDLPWRQPAALKDPYRILVSELMLQQTQVSRVIPKYERFLEEFPTIQALAMADQSTVLAAWSGLGYNRRARYLQQAAQTALQTYGGLPQEPARLQTLPGVGPNTAGAIAAYAFNKPVVFIETNIRTIYIHHFFADDQAVDDKTILTLVQETLDHEQPREWYWALMDYGSYLKQTIGNLNLQSKHYVKQSKFAGSKRQLRGQVLKLLIAGPRTAQELAAEVSDDRLDEVLQDLANEGLIAKATERYTL